MLLLRRPWELEASDAPQAVELQVQSCGYWPSRVDGNPWADARTPRDPQDLPSINVTSADAEPETVTGFGSLRGSLRLATLLLDLSQPDNASDLFQLEGEPGVRGVAPLSQELVLALPGSTH